MDLSPRHEGHHEAKTDQYWALGYSFEALDDAQKHQRRDYLDWYGFAAQWSVLLILAGFQLVFFLNWIVNSALNSEQPKSPSFNKRPDGVARWLRGVHSTWSRMAWWMKKELVKGWNWGTRGEWIGGLAWTAWLLYLCFAHTRPDYLHLTKRFGQVGASQLPLHYLLAMRAPYSPVQYLTRLSHEHLKAAHQILGRIVYLLFILHAVFYFVFFAMSGVLVKRLKDWDVIFGLVCIVLFAAISTTALGFVRRRNYRVFYISHIAIANLIIVPMFLHVSHIRVYIYEIIAVNALHIIFRAVCLKMYQGTVRLLPGTNLVQIRIPLPSNSSALKWHPGQHVYLGQPWGKAKPPSYFDQWLMVNKSNPFTVASIPAKDKELLLVARTLNGNTAHLANLARSLAQGGSGLPMLPTATGDIPILPLALEGPYGASTQLPDLCDYDRVLLVAGGVGATFIMPIYRSIMDAHDASTPAATQIRFIWAVQKLADTQWAFPESADADAAAAEHDENNNATDALSLLLRPSEVEVFVTRPSGPPLHADPNAGVFGVADDDGDDDAEQFELQENEQLLSLEEQMQKPRAGMRVRSGRPRVGEIVDEVFSRGMRTAVVVCGPRRLVDDVRASVEPWVAKGRDVFWYDESFGW